MCRVLSQDWPTFPDSKYKLDDSLLRLREEFEGEFLCLPENEKKKLRWVEEWGRMEIIVLGVSSVVSELQASVMVFLNRSYRPIKVQ
jgi:hypothetical protein